MSPVFGKEARPIRNRIVIYFDRAREMVRRPLTISTQNGGRRPNILLILGLVLLVLILGVSIGAYFWWQHYKTTPAYSLALLVDASESEDMEAFNKLVETDSVIESFVPQVTEKALGRYVAVLTDPLRQQIVALVRVLVPSARERVHEELTRQVSLLGERAAGKPFFIIALAVPWVVKIEEAEERAKVVLELENRHIELTMEPTDDERWRIVAVKDETLATIIVDRIAKDLPLVGGQIKDEIQRRIEQSLSRESAEQPQQNLNSFERNPQ